MQKFWAVVSEKTAYRAGGSYYQFSHKHTSKESAQTEAQRLARNNDGTNFMVLELVGHAGPVERPIGWTEAKDEQDSIVPF